MNVFAVYSGYPIGQNVPTRTVECRLIGDIPEAPQDLLSYLKGTPWERLPPDVQERGQKEMFIAGKKRRMREWAAPINELEWRYIQTCWENQSPSVVFIKSREQLWHEVTAITGDHSDDDGIDFGTSFNFAVDIRGVPIHQDEVEAIYHDTRRHFLLAQSCLRQIKIINVNCLLRSDVIADLDELELTLEEFFTAPAAAQKGDAQ